MTASLTDPRRQPISTAPKNGLTIIVGHEDVGEFAMHWDAKAENPLFAPDATGMWVMTGGPMTWAEVDDMGPAWWRPLA